MTRFIVATGLLSVLSALSLSTAAEDKAVEVTYKSGETKQCDGVSYMSSDFPGLNFDVYHKFRARQRGDLDRHSWEEIPAAYTREIVVAECERTGELCCRVTITLRSGVHVDGWQYGVRIVYVHDSSLPQPTRYDLSALSKIVFLH
jgi:hypothetical protein